MTTLLIDALIAIVKLTDRGLSAVENVWLRVNSPEPVVATQPTGAGSGCAASAGPGGHPDPQWRSSVGTWTIPDRATSSVLYAAVAQLTWAFQGNTPAVVRDLQAEMRDRAAQFSAVGD